MSLSLDSPGDNRARLEHSGRGSCRALASLPRSPKLSRSFTLSLFMGPHRNSASGKGQGCCSQSLQVLHPCREPHTAPDGPQNHSSASALKQSANHTLIRPQGSAQLPELLCKTRGCPCHAPLAPAAPSSPANSAPCIDHIKCCKIQLRRWLGFLAGARLL